MNPLFETSKFRRLEPARWRHLYFAFPSHDLDQATAIGIGRAKESHFLVAMTETIDCREIQSTDLSFGVVARSAFFDEERTNSLLETIVASQMRTYTEQA